jgi:tRNA-(ms[2]io[6]A)-hydroxylase
MRTPILPLQQPSSPRWAEMVCSQFDRFLLDHAACERKAAALAMSLICKYSDRTALIEPMISLAREELEHFAEVYRLLRSRKIPFTVQDEKDPYIHTMLSNLRTSKDERFLDQLVVSGLIEARGYERFQLLSEHLKEPRLQTFYRDLARREVGHYRIFIQIAERYFSSIAVEESIARISHIEQQALDAAPVQPTVHGGTPV